jgi:hypothetical protein
VRLPIYEEDVQMSKRPGLTATLIMILASTGLADPSIGEDAPKIEAGSWFNLPPGIKALQAEHLKGSIVMVEFWNTASSHSRSLMTQLALLRKQFQSKGVIVLALCDEPRSKIAPYVEKNTISCVIGADARSTFESYGIQELPAAFLIAPDGKVAWKGHPSVIEEEINKLLKEKPPKKGGLFTEKSAQAAFKKADRYYKDKKYAEAMDAFSEVAGTYKGTKTAKQAKEQMSKMKSNSKIMDAVKKHEAEIKSKCWLEIARTCAAYGEKQDALKYYNKIIDKYGDYETAKLARQEKGSLGIVEEKSDKKKDSGKKGKKADADEGSSGDEDSDDSEEDSEEEDSGD